MIEPVYTFRVYLYFCIGCSRVHNGKTPKYNPLSYKQYVFLMGTEHFDGNEKTQSVRRN